MKNSEFNTMSNQKFTKEDQRKLQEELEREREEELEDEQQDDEQNENEQEDEETKRKDKKTKKTKKRKKSKRKRGRNKKDKDKNNKRHIPISLIILIILLLGGLIGLGVYLYLENEKDVDFSYPWQEVYYNYLKSGLIDKDKDKASSQIYKENNPKMYFLDVKENGAPVMITISNGFKKEYQDSENKKYKNLMTIHNIESGMINTSKHFDVDKIMFLYNIEEDSYGWYLYEKDSDKGYIYTSLNDIVNYSDSNARKYKFENSSEFDQTFIEVKVNISKYSLSTNMSSNKLKNTIVKATNNIKMSDDILTDKVVNDIKNKTAKEEEQEVKSEEKSQETKEEVVDGIKAGEYMLYYGMYSNSKEKLTLSRNGVCHYNNDEKDIDQDGSYVIQTDSNSSQYKIVVTVNKETFYFTVNGNNKLSGENGSLNYQE